MASINKQIFSVPIKSTGNKIGERGAKSMSEALKVNTTLTKLDLTSEHIEMQTSSNNCSFFNLYIKSTGNDIGEIGAKSLGEALKANATLTKLSLLCTTKETTHNFHPSTIRSFILT